MHGILSWPEHHQGIAWWIAIIVSSPVWIKWAWQALKVLPIWGAKFQRHQLAVKIRVLETLHGDTNRLVLYLAREALNIAWEFALMSICLAAMAVITGRTLTVSSVVIVMAATLGASMVGNVSRLRELVHNLLYYDESIARLKQKQGNTNP